MAAAPPGAPVIAKDGTTLTQRYELHEIVGKGSFGAVYRGVDRETKQEVAIKIIDLESAEDEVEEIQKEIAVLSQCRSPYVTTYYGSYLHQSKLWIIMEYMAGGSVADLLEAGPPLDEASAASILRDMLCALDYLHTEGKIHRDIKAANILLTESGDVKVADFGVSGQLTYTMSKRKTFVGTPFWMAPEVIQHSDGHNEKADIWSLGITAIEMANGQPPFADLHPMRVLFLIPKNEPPELDAHFSKPFREFVSLCLKKNPEERLPARELLKHKFLKNARKTQVILDRLRESAAKKRAGLESRAASIRLHPESAPGRDNQLWDFDFHPTATIASRDMPRPKLPSDTNGSTATANTNASEGTASPLPPRHGDSGGGASASSEQEMERGATVAVRGEAAVKLAAALAASRAPGGGGVQQPAQPPAPSLAARELMEQQQATADGLSPGRAPVAKKLAAPPRWATRVEDAASPAGVGSAASSGRGMERSNSSSSDHLEVEAAHSSTGSGIFPPPGAVRTASFGTFLKSLELTSDGDASKRPSGTEPSASPRSLMAAIELESGSDTSSPSAAVAGTAPGSGTPFKADGDGGRPTLAWGEGGYGEGDDGLEETEPGSLTEVFAPALDEMRGKNVRDSDYYRTLLGTLRELEHVSPGSCDALLEALVGCLASSQAPCVQNLKEVAGALLPPVPREGNRRHTSVSAGAGNADGGGGSQPSSLRRGLLTVQRPTPRLDTSMLGGGGEEGAGVTNSGTPADAMGAFGRPRPGPGPAGPQIPAAGPIGGSGEGHAALGPMGAFLLARWQAQVASSLEQ